MFLTLIFDQIWKDVPTLFQNLPKYNETVSPLWTVYGHSLLIWSKLGQEWLRTLSSFHPLGWQAKKDGLLLYHLVVVVSQSCCALVCRLWGPLKHQPIIEQGQREISRVLGVCGKSTLSGLAMAVWELLLQWFCHLLFGINLLLFILLFNHAFILQ